MQRIFIAIILLVFASCVSKSKVAKSYTEKIDVEKVNVDTPVKIKLVTDTAELVALRKEIDRKDMFIKRISAAVDSLQKLPASIQIEYIDRIIDNYCNIEKQTIDLDHASASSQVVNGSMDLKLWFNESHVSDTITIELEKETKTITSTEEKVVVKKDWISIVWAVIVGACLGIIGLCLLQIKLK